MRPATIKNDRQVWKLWKGGIAPKDIVSLAHRGEIEIAAASVGAVYNALYRERRRRGIPLKHWLGPKKTKKDKKVVA